MIPRRWIPPCETGACPIAGNVSCPKPCDLYNQLSAEDLKARLLQKLGKTPDPCPRADAAEGEARS